MKYVNFELHIADPDGIILKKLAIDDKYINKGALLFVHQTMFVSAVGKKKNIIMLMMLTLL